MVSWLIVTVVVLLSPVMVTRIVIEGDGEEGD